MMSERSERPISSAVMKVVGCASRMPEPSVSEAQG